MFLVHRVLHPATAAHGACWARVHVLLTVSNGNADEPRSYVVAFRVIALGTYGWPGYTGMYCGYAG